jgi:hypothetical protein
MAMAKPCPSSPRRLSHGHAHVVEADHARGLGIPAHLLFLLAVADARGVGGHQQAVMPFGPAPPVRSITTSTSVSPAPEMNTLLPLIT